VIFAELARLAAQVGTPVEAELAQVVAGTPPDPLGGSTIPAAAASAVIARYGLRSPVELALLALPLALAMARPGISGFRVAAVGIEGETGDLVLGANLEFPGTELGTTIHAEGFVALRVRRRGRTLATLAVREARPCAHCRQTLAEAAAADDLRIVDTLGNDRSLADLYPVAFRPSALGMDGDAPGRTGWPSLAFSSGGPDGPTPPESIVRDLLAAGRSAHAPYSAAPSAVVLRLRDGTQVSAGCVESVAFNPSITAAQAALVELAAARREAAEVSEAWLGAVQGGPVDPEPGFRVLLGAVAPGAAIQVARWRTGAA
jgi:cytidine deaminase